MSDQPRFDPGTVVVVVDVQNDFADPAGGLYVRDGEQVVPLVSELVGAAQNAGSAVAYTQDWHPASTPHFAKDGGIWPVHCVADELADQGHDLLAVPYIQPAGRVGEVVLHVDDEQRRGGVEHGLVGHVGGSS